MINTKPKAVALFTSKDEGAPKLTASAGSLKTLLKACLVTGYGSKQSLGWEMPFEEGNTAVFRSQAPDSNRHYLQIINNEGRYAQVRGYLHMTNANHGTGGFYHGNNYDRYGYIEYNFAENLSWWLIGHDKRFILLVGKSYGNEACAMIFGDVPSIVPQDTGNTILFLGSGAESYLNVRHPQYITDGDTFLAKSWTGDENYAFAGWHSLCGHGAASATYPDKISGGLSAAEIWLYERGNGNEFNLRGLLSGLFKCQNNLKDFKDGSIIKLDGTSDIYMKFRLYNNDYHHYLINTSNWED